MVVARKVLDRNGFIDYWVDYMKSHTDEEWSLQQNVLINSVLKTAKPLFMRECMDRKKKENSGS